MYSPCKPQYVGVHDVWSVRYCHAIERIYICILHCGSRLPAFQCVSQDELDRKRASFAFPWQYLCRVSPFLQLVAVLSRRCDYRTTVLGWDHFHEPCGVYSPIVGFSSRAAYLGRDRSCCSIWTESRALETSSKKIVANTPGLGSSLDIRSTHGKLLLGENINFLQEI